MISPKRFQIVQYLLLASVLAVALYFGFVFHRISSKAASLDGKLTAVWSKLQQTGTISANDDGVNLEAIQDQARWLDSLSIRLSAARRDITNRLAFEPVIREKIRAPFQLFEYQNDRQLRLEELGAMAAEKHVLIDPAALGGFPEYSSELKSPGLLWAQLSLAHYVLEAAMQNQVAGIKSLVANPPRPVTPEENGPAAADEISVNVEITGMAPAVSRFLLCLALRGDEAKALGLPQVGGGKPAFFVERLLVRKDSAEKPDSVKVELRVTALVYRE